jgi:hemerythrin
MEWIQEFELGLPDIDAQHRDIFALVQRFDEFEEGIDRTGTRDVFVELQQVTRAHFEYEERLLAACNYPDLAKHKAEHASLLQELERYASNTLFSPRQLTRVLDNWFTSHLLMDDRWLAVHVWPERTDADGVTTSTQSSGSIKPSHPAAFLDQIGH